MVDARSFSSLQPPDARDAAEPGRLPLAALRERPGASITFAGDTFGLLRPALPSLESAGLPSIPSNGWTKGWTTLEPAVAARQQRTIRFQDRIALAQMAGQAGQ